MSWQDDPDTEGVVEENPFRYIIIGVVGLLVVTILYVEIPYNPEWFEGQNLISTIGIIFLIIFIPAIAISTLTGKSDLVKWEAIFLFLSAFMILLGNGFDFSKIINSWTASIPSLNNMRVNQLLMLILLLIGIGMAVAIAFGHPIGPGSIFLIVVIIGIMGLVNMYNAGTFDNFGQYIQEHGFSYAAGKALSDFTGGLAEGKAGLGIGLGCIVIGIILLFIPGLRAKVVAIVLLVIGASILGVILKDEFQEILHNYMQDITGKNGPDKQRDAVGKTLMAGGGGAGISGIGILIRTRGLHTLGGGGGISGAYNIYRGYKMYKRMKK